ncbi:MAG: hypothetical protein ACR2K0_10095 [Acidimicrobiales bacterium]
MARIRTTCPDCGEVETRTEDVKVRVCTDDSRGSYAFRCLNCGLAVSKPADAKIVKLLVSAGTALTMWRLPAELAEARSGQPLTHDELLAFHQLLEGPDWFSQLASMVEG